MKFMNHSEDDSDATAALEPLPHRRVFPDVHLHASEAAQRNSPRTAKARLNDPRRILPPRVYRGASIWRKFVALIGLGAFSILGGLAITLVVGVMAIVAALILQAVIS